MYCSRCGAENPDGSKFCGKCGALLEGNGIENISSADQAGASRQEMGIQAGTGNQVKKKDSRHTALRPAVLSLIFGIIGMLVFFFGNAASSYIFGNIFASVFSLILGIAGRMLAGRAKKKGNRSAVRIGGVITSLISVIGSVIVLIVIIIFAIVIGNLTLSIRFTVH